MPQPSYNMLCDAHVVARFVDLQKKAYQQDIEFSIEVREFTFRNQSGTLLYTCDALPKAEAFFDGFMVSK